MKLCYLFFFLFLNVILTAQSARFYADSESIRPREARSVIIEKSFWKIGGQKVKYGDDTLKTKISMYILDTIYFTSKFMDKLVPITCNLKEAKAIVLTYNSCCPFFNIRSEEGKGFPQRILIEVLNASKGQKYLVKFGEMTREHFVGEPIELSSYGRSAMSSNVYPLQIFQIAKDLNFENYQVSNYHVNRKGEIVYGDYGYSIRDTILDVNYLLINQVPDELIFDIQERSLSVKR